MQIVEKKIDEIIPYENNPRKNEGAVEIVMKSIQEFGFKVPIVIDKDNIIVTGHTRLKAAQKLGLLTVPVIIATDLTEEKIKAFRLADNKTAEYAEWDLEKLEQELKELKALDFDITLFDFNLQEEAAEDFFDAAEAYDAISVPTTQAGDVWQLGRHRLLCGDSTRKADMDRLIKDAKIDLVITDPPYNVNYKGFAQEREGILNDNMDDQKFRAFLTDAFKRMIEHMEPGRPIYVFHSDMEGYNFRGAFKDAGFRLSQFLVWVKQSLIMGRGDYQWRHEPIMYGWVPGAAHLWYGERDKDTVLDEDKLNIGKAKKEELVQIIKDLQQRLYENTSIIYHDKPSLSEDHPTMKPVKLIGKLVNNSSRKGDKVLDSFGGSGSTLMAAEQLGRTCYTIELDPKYCDVIVKRWEEYTGGKAARLNG